MDLFLATLALFLLAVAGMAVGLLRGRRLSGSCGGVDRAGDPIGECVCGKPTDQGCNADPVELAAIARERETAGAR